MPPSLSLIFRHRFFLPLTLLLTLFVGFHVLGRGSTLFGEEDERWGRGGGGGPRGHHGHHFGKHGMDRDRDRDRYWDWDRDWDGNGNGWDMDQDKFWSFDKFKSAIGLSPSSSPFFKQEQAQEQDPRCGWTTRPNPYTRQGNQGLLRLNLIEPLESIWSVLGEGEGGGCEAGLEMVKGLVGMGLMSLRRRRREGDDVDVDVEDVADMDEKPDTRRIDEEDEDSSIPRYPSSSSSSSSSSSHRYPPFNPSSLSSKRLLILGDSIDRVMLETTHRFISNSRIEIMDFEERVLNANGEVGVASGWPRILRFPGVDDGGESEGEGEGEEEGDGREGKKSETTSMRWDFLHFYGLDDQDIWSDKKTHENPPASLSPRFHSLLSLWGSNTYDVISLGIGLWDLGRYQREIYDLEGKDDYLGLPTRWLEGWLKDARVFVGMVREKWPDARIVWRVVHDVKPKAGGWFISPSPLPSLNDNDSDDISTPNRQIPLPPFSPLRIQQIRQAQWSLIHELDLIGLPFTDVMRGQWAGEGGWLKDDIHPDEAGCLIHAEMLMELLVG